MTFYYDYRVVDTDYNIEPIYGIGGRWRAVDHGQVNIRLVAYPLSYD